MSKDQNEQYLKEHYKGEFLVYLGYFIECYFVQGYGYDELPRLIREYKNNEVSSQVEGLLRELILIKEKDDWDYVQQFVRKHGMRLLPHEKLKAMVDLLINVLENREL
jgi:hypothetical protein